MKIGDKVEMKVKPIKTDEDNQAALEEIDRLFGAIPDTPECDRLEVLVALVVTYENQRYPMNDESTLMDELTSALNSVLEHTIDEYILEHDDAGIIARARAVLAKANA